MADFLVQIEVRRPDEIDESRWAELDEREATRAGEYLREGIIQRIWRVPGTHGNVGVWNATDATELHRRISELPKFPFMSISVTPLALHYLEESLPAR